MTQTVIVALETATEGCSVAVYRDGDIFEHSEEAPRRHTARLLPMLEAVMAEAGIRGEQVSAVAFGQGPGAFAGVRLAASSAQGLCTAWGVPALPVSTLAALAEGARRRHGAGQVLAALDARMGQVYWGSYRTVGGTGVALAGGVEAADAPEDVDGGGTDWFGVGRGFAAYAGRLPDTGAGCDPEALPEARDLLPMALAAWQAGRAIQAEAVRPVYLREGV
ncbi:MAG: tRNA (adenosine(37)-N6)-threonylcarbamoyltransferase complex dimerization subunit type 1 TsaB [Halorhodospira halophila]|uniref:tRNA (adenosine(37)-N6)-threonylcarbamoyltransferase complex dimerization subunit type 1 TsaB n=1 Tax=Halorhodospira TaxID=85108 RepID=UPI001EE7BBD6|nr:MULTISPECIES: tRNA (adenosine(37)-N6)-threonylcarbamoyltransferase complex dimerization subunit type 1 TsaB [Halorhodospira]MCC3749918.1 tRNA (adenosine(37)-N6)-threonylcarbamoyltransferase complex dimerization subunit type 1 TsaB [Halorhodospira halophila]MCG5527838.1 tRNA (adenosine(37)-N6)-threonylcarbamoyltransferase complex dimerization subunit type 1 TsaB [Halorhodospira halophila]MCG5533967.1 tRNA (adenosine(37)-N6)-threonylcarbamoyltransferase complex dimerization subunit type 1 TsaB 